ncbi:PAS domain S-box-containing protein [Flavobacterium sp. PL11]|uniref:PAS domain S-box protein n=1 Tax=Flavobacterium sp. PL11 TaxID=3071717 RepID=UPI002E084310|nr:PAS domain S-box-containing protein [Flavobacterium sp. PL11]
MSKEIPENDKILNEFNQKNLDINGLEQNELADNNFGNLIQGSQDFVCVVGFDSYFKEINPAFVKILGYTKQELLSQPFLSFVHEDDHEKSTAEILLLSQGNSSIDFKNRYIKKNREVITVHWNVTASISNELIYGIGRDFTDFLAIEDELLKSKKLLNYAQHIGKIGSWELNLDTKVMTWSNEMFNIIGVERESKLNLLDEFTQILTDKNKSSFLQKIDQTVADKNQFELEQYVTLLNGNKKYLHIVVLPTGGTTYNSTFLRGSVQDISEKKKNENIINHKEAAVVDVKIKLIEQENNAKFKSYIENAPDAVFVCDENGRYIDLNNAAIELTGYSRDELLLLKFGDLATRGYDEHIPSQFIILKERGFIKAEMKIIRKDGEKVFCLINAVKLLDNQFLGFVKNITESKIAEKKLSNSEKRFRALVEYNDGIITVLDKNLFTIFRSPSSVRITGYTDQEFEKLNGADYYHPEYLDYIQLMIQKSIDQPDVPLDVIFKVKHKNGKYIWLQGILNNKIDDDSVGGIIANLKDVTEFIKTNETLLKEKDRFLKIAATSPGLIYSMRQNKDGSLSFPYAGNAIEELYGFTFEQIENDSNKIFNLIHPQDLQRLMLSIKETKSKLIPLKGEYRYYHPIKGLVWHNVNSLPIVEKEGTIICHGTVTDVTDRIHAEQKVARANRLYLFITQINQMIVRTKDQETLFADACSIAVNIGQFKMAWIGLVDADTHEVVPAMIAGDDNGYFTKIQSISVNDEPVGRGPAGRSIREVKSIVSNDIANDYMMIPWREEALARGYLSMMSVPIKKFGNVIGSFLFYSGDQDFFDQEEIALLEEATNDVAYALENFDREALRKKAEEDIIESEQRFHTLTEVSPVGIFRTDSEGLTTYINSCWSEITGLPYNEAMGNGWLKAVHDDDLLALFEGWDNATINQEISIAEYRFIRPDGTIAWVMGKAIPERNFKNEVIGYIGTITDITERKIAEASILREKQLSEMIINNLPGIFYLYESSGNFVMWNKNLEEVTGYDSATIATMTAMDFVDSDQKEKINARINKIFLNAAQKGNDKLQDIEIEFVTKGQEKISYYINSHTIDYKGQKCILGMGIDLTEIKKAEAQMKTANERYEMISAATNDAVFEVDLLTGESWNNKKFTELLGFGNTKATGAKSTDIWRSRVHPEDKERVIKKLEDTYAGISNYWSDQFRFLKADGTFGIFYDRGIILRDDLGKAIRMNGALVEITELANVKNQLINSEEKYKSLIEQASDAIFINNADGRLLEVNESACIMLGYSKEELCSKSLPDLYTKQELISRPIMYKELLSGQQTILEREMLHKDGTLVTVEITAKMIADGRIVAIVRNVTERKIIDDAFKKMHKKIEAILNAIPDLLFEVDLHGTIFNHHSRHEDLLVRPSHEVIGKNFREILPSDASDIVLSAIKEASLKGFSAGMQYILHLDSGIHWFELSVAPMQESVDNEIHFICLCRDITKAKNVDLALFKSEDRYRELLSNLDTGIVVHASDTSIILANKKATELLGVTDDQINGITAFDPFWNFLNDDKSVMKLESYPVNQILASRKPLKNFIVGVNNSANSDIIWLLVNGYPDMDDKGNINEVVVSFIDITDQKMMDMELIKAKELAESASKAKTDFLANMSHEIRTPLNGIIGFTHLLMQSDLKKNQAEYMTTVNESAMSLMEIVNDVLDFSKIESGKLELNIEKLNVYKLSNQVINLFKHQADHKKIDLILNIEKNIPQFILGDSIRLKQILVNLLSNAIKFTSFGEIHLDISETRQSDKNETAITFSVKDTGVGIKDSNNEKIFKSFVQEDNSTNRKFGGTGLGLSISNQLLALMDSKLQLISKYGEGSNFFFTVKFTKAKSKKNTQMLTELIDVDYENIGVSFLGQRKILIVEDNKINMLLAKTLVKRTIKDCIILEAKDGNEAVAIYSKEQPDLIIMDIQMPNKNGYEATKEIRNLQGGRDIPIIAITAGIMSGDKEKCLEAGMNDYLPKPIIHIDLENILLKWLIKK